MLAHCERVGRGRRRRRSESRKEKEEEEESIVNWKVEGKGEILFPEKVRKEGVV